MAIPKGLGEVMAARRQRKKAGPLWEGPSGFGPNGGVTQSLLQGYLVCRERFRLRVVEGLRSGGGWQKSTGYGDMWHVCEEAFAGWNDASKYKVGSPDIWEPALEVFVREQCRLHPLSQEQIVHWWNVCKVQFPLYVRHWANHPDVVNRTPLLSEQVFDVPYALPSGREVRLRGKWDSVDLVKEENGTKGIWLMENKTKGDVDVEQIKRQMSYDLQCMLYLVSLRMDVDAWAETAGGIDRIRGVRFNVVRRPLSGGRGTIVCHKAKKGKKCGKCKGAGRVATDAVCQACRGKGRTGAVPEESWQDYYARLSGVIAADPSHFFQRFRVEVSAADVAKFRRECLDPVLESLCDWWSVIGESKSMDEVMDEGGFQSVHFRMPFGVYSPLLDGGSTDVDAYLDNGSEAGLQRMTNMFPELA